MTGSERSNSNGTRAGMGGEGGLSMEPSPGADPTALSTGENVGGSGHWALALKEESERDLDFLSAHTVHLKFEDSLHNWHRQPHLFLEFWLSPRHKEHPECGGLTLVLFNFPNQKHWS